MTGAAALVAALAACSGGQPGAAAVVGDRVVSSDDVDTATRELADVLQGVTQSAIVGVLVQEPLVVGAAQDAGVGVSPEQADDALQQQVAAAGGDEDREFSESSVDVMRYVLSLQALQGASDAEQRLTALQEDLSSLDFEINPRFGSRTDQGTIGATTYPWLVAQDAAADATP